MSRVNPTIERLLEIATAATAGPWLEIETESSVDFEDEDDAGAVVARVVEWSDIGTAQGQPPIAIVLKVFDERKASLTPIDANVRYLTTFNPARVISVLNAVAATEAALKELDDRIWSAMQSQREDVRVNGRDNPGLLEPMAEILTRIHERSRELLRTLTASIEEART